MKLWCASGYPRGYMPMPAFEFAAADETAAWARAVEELARRGCEHPDGLEVVAVEPDASDSEVMRTRRSGGDFTAGTFSKKAATLKDAFFNQKLPPKATPETPLGKRMRSGGSWIEPVEDECQGSC